ncbi:MAG: protease complex subunit PrcB family protein [Wujia sp.]
MKGYKSKLTKAALAMAMLLFLLSGCKDKEETVRSEIDFTVCDKTKIPEELFNIIEEKKTKVFKLSYINDSYMYVVVGYGEKSRDNMHVVVEDLYMTDSAIFVETNLYTDKISASDTDAYGESSMYPYIVLKFEKYDLPVVFDID